MIFETTLALPVLSQTDRDAIASLPRTIAAHDTHMVKQPFMGQIQIGGTALDVPLTFPFTLAAWNDESCLFPQASADLLHSTRAAVVLLSELDNGMARTTQNKTTARAAEHLGIANAFGVEFL